MELVLSLLDAQNLPRRIFQRSVSSDMRDALKFFRKRTACKCLKKLHLEARKTTPKMGRCGNCSQEKERVSLSVCSRCMATQYCSRECQVAAWPKHKKGCDILLACNHNKYTKEETSAVAHKISDIGCVRMDLL